MTTLADKAILSGADNRPPMLEKDMYDSWKSRMELYMMNRQHGRMILEFVENGPLILPTIEENGVTRPKIYSELSATEAIQADCDVKATNIILQGLPPEERGCELYDEFDKFAYKKGETLRDFYLRFSLLLNDMNIYNMSKLVRDLTQTNIVQLHAYLWTHEFHANGSFNALTQLRDPLLHGCNPSDDLVSLSSSSKLVPKHSISTMSFTHISIQKGDDPIDAINHMMSFLTAVVTSRYPPTNNQLRNSSNPRQQAIINDGRITLQLKAQQLEPKLYDGNVIKNTSDIVIPDSEETLMLAEESHHFSSSITTKVEVPKELPKVSMVNTSLKRLKPHLTGFDKVVKERTTATAITEGTWGFEDTKACFRDEIIPFVKALKDIFSTFNQYLIDELTEVQNIFHQMEQAMEQHRLESKTFEVKMNQVLNKNERLLEQVISKDIVNIIMNTSVDNASVNVYECKKCLELETELLNKKDFVEKEIYDKLFRSFTTLEKHCISLEVDSQLNQENFQMDNSVSNQSDPSFDQYFELNELKAQFQEKNMVIKKLKERIKSLSGKVNEDKIKKDLEEIETINIELDHREKVLVITTLKNELRKLKGKTVADNAVTKHTINPEMLKIDMEPITPTLLNPRTAHSAYIKRTQKEVAFLRDLVEHVKSSYPLDHSLESACRYTKQIQELLTNISQTFPSVNNSGVKLVAVTPKNKDKRVRFLKPVTSSKNTKTTSSSNLVTNKLALSSTGVRPSTSASGSQPSRNTKKDKIQQPSSSNLKNKVEAHPRTVKSSLKNKNSVVEHRGIANVQHSKHNTNSKSLCVKCNGCMLSDNHDLITITAEVPPRKLTALKTNTPKPITTLVYLRKPSKSKVDVPVSKPKILKYVSANNKEPSQSRGSIVSNVPSSSLDECRSSKLFSEGLGHNLFSIRQFCDSNLDVAFHQHTYFIRNLEGVDLLTGSRGNNLYTLSLRDMMASSPICLLSKASKTKSWLWHRRLSHLNFDQCVSQVLMGRSTSLSLSMISENLDFNELTTMASEHSSSGPALHEMTPAIISSGLVSNPPPLTLFVPPSRTDWVILFQPLFDELLTPPPSVDDPAPEVVASIDEVVAPEPAASTSSPSSTTVDQDAPSPSISQTIPETQSPIIPDDVEEDNHDLDVAHMDNDPYFGIPILEVPSEQSSSTDSIHTYVHPDHQISKHNSKWTKDHPLKNIIGQLARPVSIRLQLHEQALLCYYDAFLTANEPKTQPDGFVELDNPNHVYKLKKDLYGLKQAPRAWYDMLSSFLISQDFSKGLVDPTLFICGEGDELLLMSMMGKISFSLGLQISQNLRGIFINQSKYALESLKKYGFDSCDLVDTPMVEKSKLDEDKEGKAAWPTEKHLHAVKRIFRYLRGTVNQGLWYPKDSSVALTTFADADHAGCQDSCRSTSGSMQFLGDRLLTDYGLGFTKISMYYDNKSAIALCCNNVQNSRSKHIDIRFHFIKEHVENGVIELYFVNTEYQLADIFKKSLARERIKFLINKLGMRSFTSETLNQLADEVDESG
ncbi:retrovirus-related pol polyprotein from transposon TNT 1-94, partial [Tanacetum coccineum]